MLCCTTGDIRRQYTLTVSDIVLYAVFIYGELLYCRINPVRDGDDTIGDMTLAVCDTVCIV